MKYAEVDGKRMEAKAGLKGVCPGCAQPVIAKCGEVKVHHWAHARNSDCDSWWEPETEWHRRWKSLFPEDWQEVFLPDPETGEKHIADLHTDKGLVVEFQHSHIDPKERISREKFYKSMVWVVDGVRLKRDFQRFENGAKAFKGINSKGMYRVDNPEEAISDSWIGSSVPIILDFLGNEQLSAVSVLRQNLYCIFPIRFNRSAVLEVISRTAFTRSILDGSWMAWVHQRMAALIQVSNELQAQNSRKANQLPNNAVPRIIRPSSYRKGRRF